MASAVTPSPSVNRTACKRSLQARSGLRPPPAGYVERWTTAFLKVQRQQRADTGRTPWQRERPQGNVPSSGVSLWRGELRRA
ncbi:hypothetical protein ACO3_200024 [Thiomonas arsenitoxydans]|nr:hypothetical protein ACO3_200024 [Thiomonas arsenitoxydans]